MPSETPRPLGYESWLDLVLAPNDIQSPAWSRAREELADLRERLRLATEALRKIDDYDSSYCNCPPEACGCEKRDLQQFARDTLAKLEEQK